MITNAQEFRQKLLEIQNSTIQTFTTLPSDEPRFLIDANTREISIPAEFNFIAVKNDHKAETIYFEIDRYFDDIDLSEHTCVVQFLNRGANTLTHNEGICAITSMDVNTLDGKILFGWQITNDATSFAGDLYFAVRFYSIDENGYFTYNLNTLASESIVLDTLDVRDSSSNISSSLLLQWIAKISEVTSQVESNTQAIKEINEKLENYTGGIDFIIDDTLSEVSINAVQNKTVATAISQLSEEIEGLKQSGIGSGSGATTEQANSLWAIIQKTAFAEQLTEEEINTFKTSWGITTEIIPATGITLNKTTLSFTDSATQTLIATVEPSNSTDKITWESSNTAISTVSNGVVTPVSNGSCTITAKAGSYSANCDVTVAVEGEIVTYTITNDLVNATSDNLVTSINEGSAYNATITANSGYTLEGATVSVTMGGTDITSTTYSNGAITIASVTGNIAIIVSAVQSSGETTVELITDGLQCNYDFRGVTLESYNLTGWGAVYRTLDKTGNEMIFGDSSTEGDATYGLKYNFRDRRLISSEINTVKFGENYTVQALYYDCQPSLFSWGSNVVLPGKRYVKPIYVNTSGSKVTVDAGQSSFSGPENKFTLVTYVVSGSNLKIYYNDTLLHEIDGNSYEDFDHWVDYGCPLNVYTQGYCVAFVGYNRALSDVEIVDNMEYFETMEVSA